MCVCWLSAYLWQGTGKKCVRYEWYVCNWVRTFVSRNHTCLHAGLNDAYDCSPQHILGYGEVVLSVFKHRWRHQACHHTNIDSGIGEGNQTTTILGRNYHWNNRIGLPKNWPRQGDHTCKSEATDTFQRGLFFCHSALQLKQENIVMDGWDSRENNTSVIQ